MNNLHLAIFAVAVAVAAGCVSHHERVEAAPNPVAVVAPTPVKKEEPNCVKKEVLTPVKKEEPNCVKKDKNGKCPDAPKSPKPTPKKPINPK